MTIKDTMTQWATSPGATPVVPLGSQGFLAVLFSLVALAGTGVFLTSSSKTTSTALFSALVASLATGFGAVYIVNAVHVYTG
ncbi:hypothetical protein B9G98_04687 [Wickerhamiella sorbophila]|uniref:Dolichyl-diphosphooligosaccharide-protein glycosyltransferase subunit OST5 n=1 Tax=Wickerhamiella sorbophila TaxID=45607 RepID=A0A2T0FQ27_9ASCO|nr:hypothetical protein B9G98_04687 [Wickerhamiella sorbophila]PRT57067.1 hypothetical protein B9G98_04687 [Wickerhamiella sorbophila]